MDSGARKWVCCWMLGVIAAAACGGPAMAICDDIPLLAHHDGSFEWGYTWYCQGYPDGGSFAEGFAGPGIVCGIQAYLCEMNISCSDVAVFVWDSEECRRLGRRIAMYAAARRRSRSRASLIRRLLDRLRFLGA